LFGKRMPAMKKVGLIGGISWVSTLDYYRYINLGVNEKLGGNNFAECVIYSFNYQDIINCNNSGDFEGTFSMLCAAALSLKNSGVEAIVLCANTLHMYAERLEDWLGLPVIHVAQATASAISSAGLKTVGLLLSLRWRKIFLRINFQRKA
jgi:aspartate racemase